MELTNLRSSSMPKLVGTSMLLWFAFPKEANAFPVRRTHQIRSLSTTSLHVYTDKVVVSPSSSIVSSSSNNNKAKRAFSAAVTSRSSFKREEVEEEAPGWKFWEQKKHGRTLVAPHHHSNALIPDIFAGLFSSPNNNDATAVSKPPTILSTTTTTTPTSSSAVLLDPQQQALTALVVLVGTVLGARAVWEHTTNGGGALAEILAVVQNFLASPQAALQSVVDHIQAMGPAGLVYFGILYTLAEVLAVPATPLTLSAGYLFGMTHGVMVVLISATIAASIAFVVGKTVLRSWVEEMLEENPKFAKLDKAVGEQGFKLLVLLRLSPLFPFALSNYLYGASSISFPAYFWGTLLGFAPGTLAYVYTGMVGKELLLGNGDSVLPWYIYAAGLVGLGTLLKLVSDVAGGIVEAIDDDDDDGATPPLP